MESISEQIRTKAAELGFFRCGFAKAEALSEEKNILNNYLAQKRNAGLHFLEKNPEKRTDPRLVMENARSVIAVLMNYYPEKVIPETDNFVIAKYAYGRDYHALIMEKLNILADFIKQELGASDVRRFVDASPLLEKAWAQRCGLGWIGKNTLLINQSQGSFFFIGILLTDLIPDYDKSETDHCGTCDKCLKACPTGALIQPYTLDTKRCISFHTLENKEEIPAGLKGLFKDRVYGCDICQDVCPFNNHALPTTEPEFSPNPLLFNMQKHDWISLDKETFTKYFSGTTIGQKGYERLMRNIRFVSGKADPGAEN